MTEQTRTDVAERFFPYLAALCDADRAVGACLRRSLSFPPGEWPRAFPYVEPFVAKEEQDGFRRRMFYLAAGVWAAARERSGKVSFGKAIRGYRDRMQSDSIEKRFITLLDSDAHQLPHRLRQMCALLKDEPVDFPLLLKGLLYWNTPGKATQRQWARNYYAESDTAKATKQPKQGE